MPELRPVFSACGGPQPISVQRESSRGLPRSKVEEGSGQASRAALARLGVAASLGLALVATLAPFEFAWPPRWQLDHALRISDLLLNLGLLAPLGFFLRMRGVGSVWRVTAFGATLGAVLELLQLFAPLRCTSLSDVFSNALGAGLGAALWVLAGARLEDALLRLIRRPPRVSGVALLTLGCCAVSLLPLWAHAQRPSFVWTGGLAPIAQAPQHVVLGLLSSLATCAWLGFALGLHRRSSACVLAGAALVAGGLELCRGYCNAHMASVSSLLLSLVVAALAAHAATSIQSGTARRGAERVWV